MDSSSGFSEGHFDPLILANCQPDTSPTPLYGAFWVNRCVRAYRESRLLRTHVRSKTPKFSFIGGHTRQLLGVRSGCTRASMPTKPRTRRPDELTMLLVDSRLHRFTPQLENQRPAVLPSWISCPLSAAFSGSPTWGSSPGIPCRRSCGFQGATGKTATKKPSQNRPALPSLFLEGHASRLCNG